MLFKKSYERAESNCFKITMKLGAWGLQMPELNRKVLIY